MKKRKKMNIKFAIRHRYRNKSPEKMNQELQENYPLIADLVPEKTERQLEKTDTMIASVDDKERIADIQNLCHADSTPYNLADQYREQKLAEARKRSDQAKERLKETITDLDFDAKEMAVDGFNAFLRPEAVRTKNQFISALKKQRSQYLADQSVKKLSEDIDEVHTLVGAAHQPQMIQHLEEIEDQELSEMLEADPDGPIEVELK
jgi:hypothetical protein